MKIRIARTGLVFALAASFISNGILHAQTNDSIVNWEADVAGLSLLQAAVPSSGTFWLVTSPNGRLGGVTAPYPCLPSDVGTAHIYVLANGAFLVDGTAGNDGGNAAQLAGQMNAVSNVIQQAETVAIRRAPGKQAMDSAAPPSPGGGGTNDGGYVAPEVQSPTFTTNDLWLQLAKLREKEHPADTVPVYQRLVEPIIAQMKNPAYEEATLMIRHIRELMYSIGQKAEFAAYLAQVRLRHKPKRNLMKLLDNL